MKMEDLKKEVIQKIIELNLTQEKLLEEIMSFPDDEILEEILAEYFTLFSTNIDAHIDLISDINVTYEKLEDVFHFIVSTQYLMHKWIGVITIFKSINKKEEMDSIGYKLEVLMGKSDLIATQLEIIKEEYENQSILFMHDYASKNNIENDNLNLDFFKALLN